MHFCSNKLYLLADQCLHQPQQWCIFDKVSLCLLSSRSSPAKNTKILVTCTMFVSWQLQKNEITRVFACRIKIPKLSQAKHLSTIKLDLSHQLHKSDFMGKSISKMFVCMDGKAYKKKHFYLSGIRCKFNLFRRINQFTTCNLDKFQFHVWLLFCLNTACQPSCGKVMFSVMCVCV